MRDQEVGADIIHSDPETAQVANSLRDNLADIGRPFRLSLGVKLVRLSSGGPERTLQTELNHR